MTERPMLDRDGNPITDEEAINLVNQFKVDFYTWAFESDVDMRVAVAALCDMLPLLLLSNLEGAKAIDTINSMLEYTKEMANDTEFMHQLMRAGAAGEA